MSIRTASALIVLVLATQGLAADRQKTKDLLKDAEQAAAEGKLEQAEKLACDASGQDKKNKDAQQKCTNYHELAQAQRDTDHKHVNDGSGYFVMKKFDEAEKEFLAIKSSSYAAVKKEYLEKIAAERAKLETERQKKEHEAKLAEEAARKKATEVEAAMKKLLDQGIAAYEKNDFASAKKTLASVTSNFVEQSQRYIANIDQYTQAMTEGEKREKAGKIKQAIASYQRAVSIKANGPNKPKDKIANLQKLQAGSQSQTQEDSTAAAASSANDQQLVAAIQQYYQGNYAEAETQLSSYAGTSDKMKALARFYLGASKLSRSYMTVDQAEKHNLTDSAKADFAAAKQTADFFAPEQAVSPKIAKAYQASAQ